MSEHKHIVPTASEKDRQAGSWRERIAADLRSQVEAGGTLYGYRRDGAYVARTREGDQVLKPPLRKTE